MKDHYFFFKEEMPIAVFLTESKGDAIDLFGRLYRQSWTDSIQSGVTVAKEDDVPYEKWQKVHDTYKAKAALREKIEDSKRNIELKAAQLVQAKSVMPKCKPIMEQGNTVLETAKYLR